MSVLVHGCVYGNTTDWCCITFGRNRKQHAISLGNAVSSVLSEFFSYGHCFRVPHPPSNLLCCLCVLIYSVLFELSKAKVDRWSQNMYVRTLLSLRSYAIIIFWLTAKLYTNYIFEAWRCAVIFDQNLFLVVDRSDSSAFDDLMFHVDTVSRKHVFAELSTACFPNDLL